MSLANNDPSISGRTATMDVSMTLHEHVFRSFVSGLLCVLLSVAGPRANASPPTAPGSLTATGVSSTQIVLSWAASSDDTSINSYVVQRCQGTGCTNFAQIGTVSAGTAFIDSGLSFGTTYQYQVYATDSLNTSSSPSNLASAATLAASASGSVSYAYDALGRMVQATAPSLGIVENYAYDAGGNLLSINSNPISSLAVSALSATHGAPGSVITIDGSGFSTTTSSDVVTIGGVQATVISATSTELVISVPQGSDGYISVTVGSNTASSATPFVVASSAPPTISGIPSYASPGSTIIVSGTGFQATPAGNRVTLGNSAVQVVSATPTALTVTVPAINGFLAGPITVSTPYGTAVSSSDVVISETPPELIQTLTVGAPPASVITSSGGDDIVILNGSAGQNLALSFSGATNVYFGLYGPDGSVLMEWYNNHFSSGGAIQLPTLPSTGTYVLLLLPQNQSQTIPLSVSGPLGGTLTLDGNPTNVTTSIPGQSIALTFAGDENAVVSLNLTGVTFNAGTAEVLNPDGSILTSAPLTNAGVTLNPQLPTSGTYTLLVIPSTTTTGSLSASLATSAPVLAANQGAYSLSVTNATPAAIPFEATSGEYISLTVTTSAFSGVSVSVTQPDGSVIGSQNWSWCLNCGGQVSPVLNLGPLKETGTYLVTITPNGSGQLSLYLTTPVSIGALSANTALSSPATLLGQSMTATFSVLSGDFASLTFPPPSGPSTYNTDSELTVTVLAPDGTVVASHGAPPQQPMNLGPLPEAGTYTVLMQKNQAVAGDSATLEWLQPVTISLASGQSGTPVSLSAGQALIATFTGATGQYASVTLTEPLGDPIQGTPLSLISAGSILVLDPNDAVVGSSALDTSATCAPGTGTGNEACATEYAGSGSVLYGPLVGTGTYRVVFQELGFGGSGNLVPSFTLGAPTPVTVGATTALTSAGATFAANAGSMLSIALSSSASGTTYWLLDPNGDVVAGPTSSASYIETGPLALSGTYTLVTQNAAASMSATVSTPVTGSLTLGSTAGASLTLPGQAAQYSFSGSAGQYLSATVSEGSGPLQSGAVSIISSSTGTVIASGTLNASCSSNSCSGTTTLDFGPLAASDTYSLVVQPSVVSGTSPVTSLTLLVTNRQTATVTTQNIATTTPGASVQFTFPAIAAQSLVFSIQNEVLTPGGSGINVNITDPNGGTFTSNSCYPNCLLDLLPTTLAGTYTVTLTPQNSAATMAGIASISPSLNPGALTVGNPLTVSLATGQIATIPFTAAAEQSLAVAMSSLTTSPANYNYEINIVAPTGRSVAFANTTSPVTVNLPNLAAGTYTMYIAPGGASTATMQLALVNELQETPPLAGTGVTVSTSTPGEASYFNFPVAEGQSFSFAVTGLSLSPNGVNSVSINEPSFNLGSGQPNCHVPGCTTHMAYAQMAQNYALSVAPNGEATMSFTATLSPDVTGNLMAGTPLNLSLAEMGQSAVLTFDVTDAGGGVLWVNNFAPNPSSAQYNLEVYNLNQGYSSVNSFTLSGGTASSVFSLWGLSPGTYVVMITPFTSTPAVANLQITYEPNPPTALATTGSATNITTSAPGEDAYMSFAGLAGQSVSVVLSNVVLSPSSSAELSVIVENPAGQQEFSFNCIPTAGCEITLPPLQYSGTYSVIVEPNSASTMSLTGAMPPVVSGTLTTGTPVPIQWATAGQTAAYNFTLSSPQLVAVNLDSISIGPENTSVGVSIYDLEGNLYANASSTTQAVANAGILPAGTYQVVVTPAVPATGSVRLTLEPGFGGVLPVDGSSTSFTAPAPGQNGYFTFNGVSGQSISLAVSGMANTVGLRVYDPNGGVAATPGCGAPGCEVHLILTQTGTFSVDFTPGSSAPISFTLTLSSDFIGALSAGTPLNVSLAYLGQSASVTLTATASENVALTIASINVSPSTSLNVIVYNSSGGQIFYQTVTGGTTLNLNGLASGTYSVVVTPNLPTVGSLQLSYQ